MKLESRHLVYGLGGSLLVILIGLVIYPSIELIVSSITVDGVLTFSLYSEIFDDAFLRALRNSFVVSIFGTIGATALGVGLAWLIARTDIALKWLWRTLIIVPYLIPPFIGAIAWVYLLSPVGYINRIWRELTGTMQPLFVIYGEAGVIFVMIIYTFPIAYLITVGPLREMSAVYEDAARISGANTVRTLRDVVLPLISPHIAASMLLIFMSLMANFGIPAVIGFPRRYFVLTNEIYQTVLDFGTPNNLRIAAAMSMVLVVIAIGVLLLRRLLTSRRRFTIISGKSAQPRLVRLGFGRYVAAALVGFIVLIAVVAPLLAILATSVTPAAGVPLTVENATLKHFDEALTAIPKAQRAITNSLLLAASAATVVVLMGVLIGYITVRLRWRGSGLLNGLIVLPYAIPGTVVALAMILAFLRPLPLINFSLYNTIWILLVAYIARFLVIGVQPIRAAYEQIHESLDEAARISGADALQTIRDIDFPLMRSSVAAGWFLVFMPALTELTLSALLFSVGNETIGQVVFGLHQEGKFNLTAALAFVIVSSVLVLNIVFSRVVDRRGGEAAS